MLYFIRYTACLKVGWAAMNNDHQMVIVKNKKSNIQIMPAAKNNDNKAVNNSRNVSNKNKRKYSECA